MTSKAIVVDNTHRKTWDKSEYHDKAKEREKKEKAIDDETMDARKRKRLERDPMHLGLIVQRANLKPRDSQIDLASKINKTQMQSITMPLSQQAGYYCSVCDCVLKDSLSYLDHLNGKWHNRALGMNMQVEKSTAEQVRNRMEDLKKQMGKGPAQNDEEVSVPDGINKEELEKEEQRQKKLKGGAAADNEDEEEEEVDPAIAAMFGFSTFGGSKKN